MINAMQVPVMIIVVLSDKRLVWQQKILPPDKQEV